MPTKMKLLVTDYRQLPDNVFPSPPLLLCSRFFFYTTLPLSAFSKICTWWSALCFGSLTHRWACPSALKYQMVYLCWYCRSVGFVYWSCVCLCVWGCSFFACYLERKSISFFLSWKQFLLRGGEKGWKGSFILYVSLDHVLNSPQH